jgi:CBS domain-containing protein
MRILEANPAATALLGRPPGEGGPRPGLADLFAEAEEFEVFRRELTGTSQVASRVTRLRGPSGPVAVALSAVLVRDEPGAEGYCDAVAEELGAGRAELSERDALIADLQTPLLSLNEPVRRFMRPLPACDYRTDLARAAAIMGQHRASALLVTGPGGEGIGLLADSDFCDRVVGRGLPVDRPVFEVMSAPLVAVAPTVLGYEATLLMREKGVGHLAVRDGTGAVLGVVRSTELLDPERYPLALLSRAIRGAGGVEDLTQHRRKLPLLVQALVDAGARPRSTCRAITAVSDAIAQRLLVLAVEELGPAPAPFAFIVLGSGGREEQTLVTDQDNAIIFDPPTGTDPAVAHAYFVAVGERVCDWLDRVGYPLCRGGMMAKSPRWCAPLSVWKEHFSGWIHVAEPKALLDFNTCFDFRCIHGDERLAAEVRRHALKEIARTTSFPVHLAQNALHHRPLLGFFGKIAAEADVHGSQRTFNVKEATAPIVSLARLYALRAGAAETSTFDRLGRLQATGVLTRAGGEEISQAYQFLMSLRLAHQMDSVRAGLEPTNHISIKALTQIEETMLKQIFSQIAVFQKKISFDFLGGEWAQGA